MELFTRLMQVVTDFQTACTVAPAVEPATLVGWVRTAAQALADVAARLEGWPPGSRVPPLGLKDTARLAGVLDVLLAACALGQVDAAGGDAPPGARWVRTRAKALAAHGITGDALLAAAVASGSDAAVRAQLAAAAVDAAAPVLASPWVDRRMKDRGLPDVLAAVFQLQRWGAAGGGGRAGDAAAATASRVLSRLRAALPTRVLAAALLQLVWGQVTADCVLAAPPAAGAPAAAATAVLLWDPSSSSSPPPDLPTWLHLCAGAELARILMMTATPVATTTTPEAGSQAAPGDAATAAAHDDDASGGSGGGGVEAVLDCVFDAVDLGNPVAVDRAVLAAASIVATPPVEVAGSADAYLAAVAPQLLRLLRTGGHRSDLLVTTASVALARIVGGSTGGGGGGGTTTAAAAAAASREQWRAALEHVLKPLARPLVAYGEPPPLATLPQAATAVSSTPSPPSATAAAPAEGTSTDHRPARRRPLITVVGEDASAPLQQPQQLPLRPAPAVTTLADADAVMGSVADLHRLVFISWPPPRPAASLLFALPALLDLLAMMSTTTPPPPSAPLQPSADESPVEPLHGDVPVAPTAAAMDAPAPSTTVLLVRQVAARILAAAPHGWAVATLLRYAGLDDMLPPPSQQQPRATAARAGGGGGGDDGDAEVATAPAVRTRHRRVRLLPAGGGSAAVSSSAAAVGGTPSLLHLLASPTAGGSEPPTSFSLVADTAPASDEAAAGWDDDVALSTAPDDTGSGGGGGSSGSGAMQSLLASLQHAVAGAADAAAAAAAVTDGALLLSPAHACRVGAIVDVLGTMPSTGTATHARRRRKQGAASDAPTADGGGSLDGGGSGLSTLSVPGDLFIRLLRRYTRDQLAMLAGAGSDGGDDGASSPLGAVRCLQLLIALTERLGPSLLVGRSPSAVLLLVRSLRPLLGMVAGALRLPLPDPVAAGAGEPGSLPVRIAAREDAPLRERAAGEDGAAPAAAAAAATVVDPSLLEVASLLLSLLTAAGQQVMAETAPALAAAAGGGGDGSGGDGDAADDGELADVDAAGLKSLTGTARRVAPLPSTARGAAPALPDADTIAAQAWLLSCLPLMTAIATAAGGGRGAAAAAPPLVLPLEGEADADGGSGREGGGPDDLRHAALALRYLLLSLPPLPSDDAGGGGSGSGAGASHRAPQPRPAAAAPTAAATGDGDDGGAGDATFHKALQAALDLCGGGSASSPPLVAHGLRRLVRLVAVGPRQLDERRWRQQQQGSSTDDDTDPRAPLRLLGQLFDTAVTALGGATAAAVVSGGGGPTDPAGAADDTAQQPPPDGFVAVAAVELLTVLAARHAASQLPRLVRLCCGSGDDGADVDGEPAAEGGAAMPDHVRLRAGEALAGAVRSLAAGRLLPAYADVLLPPLAAVGVRGWRRQQALATQLAAAAAESSALDATAAASCSSNDDGSRRVELSYAQVEELAGGSVPAALAAMARGGSGGAAEAAAAAAAATRYHLASRLSAWADLRASCLSVLGDVAGGLGGHALLLRPAASSTWSPARLLEGLTGVLTHEVVGGAPVPVATAAAAAAAAAAPVPSQAPLQQPHVGGGDGSSSDGGDVAAARSLTASCAARVRRAASLALRLTLDGLTADAVAGGGTDAGVLAAVLPAVTSCLRTTAAGDPDAVTRGHASDGLAAAGDLMRSSLQGPGAGSGGGGGASGRGALLGGGLRLPPPSAGSPLLVVAAPPGLTPTAQRRL
jgi:hypothetical protein